MPSFKITQKTDNEWNLHVTFIIGTTQIYARYVDKTKTEVVAKALNGLRNMCDKISEVRSQLLSEYDKE